MVKVFTMPDIGEGMAEGEISSWLVSVGEEVKEEQPIVEIQNDKILQEVLSPFSGKVTKIFVEENTICKVGDPLIEFDGDKDDNSNNKVSSTESSSFKSDNDNILKINNEEKQLEDKTESKKNDQKIDDSFDNTNIKCMPSVRKYAYENNIDLNKVKPTGNKGHIILEDVKKFNINKDNYSDDQIIIKEEKDYKSSQSLESNTFTNNNDGYIEIVPMDKTRIAISNAMVNSKHKIPHVTLFDEVEVSDLVEHRKKINIILNEQDKKITYMPYIVKALVGVIKKYPIFNSKMDDQNFTINYNKFYNIGIATDTEGGLFVPVIKDADSKSLLDISNEIIDNSKLAHSGKLTADKMKNGSITISNLGSVKGRSFTPIINYPEAAILGMGTIRKAPIVDDSGNISVGHLLDLSLSFDHRIIDGVLAQKALNLLKRYLSNPDVLLMEV